MKEVRKIIARIAVFCLIMAVISYGFNFVSANIVVTAKTDAEVKFIIYPDGTVDLSSKGNYTPPYMTLGPTVQVKGQLAKSADKYNALASMTSTFPPEQASQFPFNATTAAMTTQYSNNVANSKLNASVTLSDSFGTGGIPLDLRGFPFNSTDFSITANYTNQRFNGVITIRLASGLLLGDINVNFEGNLTQITLEDSVTVFYNYTMPFPGFPRFNETMLNELLMMLKSMIPGTGDGSLHNMTSGVLTCTTFTTTVTSIDPNTANVSFLVTVQGDFIRFLSNTLESSFPPGSVPFPREYMYSLLNATVYSAKTLDFTMVYYKAARRLDVQAAFTENLKEYWNASTSILPNMYPPPLGQYLTRMLNTTYASVHSFTENINYSNGQARYEGNYTLTGDLNAEANHIKNTYVDMLNATAPVPEWVVATLKDTDLDIANLRLNFSMINGSELWDFEGIKAAPPVYQINATTFMLEKFFNLTSTSGSPEPPRENEKLKLIVQGGNNGTHTVTLAIDPADPNRVPQPDAFINGNTATWNNQSISKLRRLIFRVWEGHAETIFDATSITPNNPYTIDAKQTSNCMLIVNSVLRPVTLSVKNVTAPTNVGALSGAYKLLGNYIQVMPDAEDVTVNVTMRVYYTTEQLSASGLSESDLKIFYWNTTASEWVGVGTQVNTSEHYAWTTIDHFSTWALLGQPVSPIWGQPWFLITIAAVVIIIIIIAAALFYRKKKPSQ